MKINYDAKIMRDMVKTCEMFDFDKEFSKKMFQEVCDKRLTEMYASVINDFWSPVAFSQLNSNRLVELVRKEKFEMYGTFTEENGEKIEKPFIAKKYWYKINKEKYEILKEACEILKKF